MARRKFTDEYKAQKLAEIEKLVLQSPEESRKAMSKVAMSLFYPGDATEPQSQIIREYFRPEDEVKRICWYAGRWSGKSILMSMLCAFEFLMAEQRGDTIAIRILGVGAGDLKKIYVEEDSNMLQYLPETAFAVGDEIRFAGSKCSFKGWGGSAKNTIARGGNNKLVILDEAAFANMAVYNAVVGSARDKDDLLDAKIVFVSTPAPGQFPRELRDLCIPIREDTGKPQPAFYLESSLEENTKLSKVKRETMMSNYVPGSDSYEFEIRGKFSGEGKGAVFPLDLINRSIVGDKDIKDIPTEYTEKILYMDPAKRANASDKGSATGMVVIGYANDTAWLIQDVTTSGNVEAIGQNIVKAYYEHRFDKIITESNAAGMWAEAAIQNILNKEKIEMQQAPDWSGVKDSKLSKFERLALAMHGGRVRLIDHKEVAMQMRYPSRTNLNWERNRNDTLDALAMGTAYFLGKRGIMDPMMIERLMCQREALQIESESKARVVAMNTDVNVGRDVMMEHFMDHNLDDALTGEAVESEVPQI